jgi:hypothetical protein
MLEERHMDMFYGRVALLAFVVLTLQIMFFNTGTEASLTVLLVAEVYLLDCNTRRSNGMV